MRTRTDSDDDEDDEDAEDSMAYSKYVLSRLSQEAEPKATSTSSATATTGRSQESFLGRGISSAANQSTVYPGNCAEKVYSIIMQVQN